MHLFILQVMVATSGELQHLESRSLSSLLRVPGVICGVLDVGFWEVEQKTALSVTPGGTEETAVSTSCVSDHI